MITQLQDHIDRTAGLPPEKFIGALLWYSISQTVIIDGKRHKVPVRITREQLRLWFHDLGLDERFLPPPPEKSDAFKKASTNVTREYTVADGRRAVLEVEEVESNTEFILRHVIRKVFDPRQRVDDDKVKHEFMGSMKFFRAQRTTAGRRQTGHDYKSKPALRLDKVDLEQVMSLLDEVEARYTDLAANLDEEKIRAVIRRYLVHLNAIMVKPQGALYFVHTTRQPTLDALQQLVHRIGQGCSMDQVPLVDNGTQRAMLTEAFQTEVEDDVRALLVKVAEANAKVGSGKVKPGVYAELNAAYQTVASRSEEYTRLLGLSQGRAATALEMALDSVMDLAQRVDFGSMK